MANNELKGVKNSGKQDVIDFNQVMSGDVGSVTSRDQFIDPYALVNPANYRKTRAGQAQYNSDLQQAQLYLEMQQAAYKEWYESPEQQAIRDREAGLNPDLLGLSDNEAGVAPQNPNSPIAGQETNGQVATRVVDSIVGVIGTAATLAGLPMQITNIGKQNKLLDKQIEGAQLINDGYAISNVTAFEQTAHQAIASKVATAHSAALAAGKSFDVAAYFADDANFADILPSYAPSDNPMYANALARVRKGSESIMAEAFKTTGEKLDSQTKVARTLANPYVSDDTKLMVSQLAPVMEAVFEMEKLSLEFQKGVTETKMEFMDAVDPTAAGESFNIEQKYQALLKKHQSIIEGAKSYVYQNLKTIYETAPISPAGFSASCMILGQVPSGWQNFLTMYGSTLIGQDWNIDGPAPLDLDNNPLTDEGALGFHPGRPTK